VDCEEPYNSVKHANRASPEVLSMLNGMRESLIVFRLWVAGRLGADSRQTLLRLKQDPMSQPYELA